MSFKQKLINKLLSQWKESSGFIGINRIILYPQSMGSQSSKDLQQSLKDHLGDRIKVLRVKPDGDYVPSVNDFIINFGNKEIPNWINRISGSPMLNDTSAVSISIDKLSTFTKLSEDPTIIIPEWTTDIEVAKQWLEYGKVYCRTMTRSSGGNGIVIASNTRELVNSPLYTRGINIHKEYRIHIFQDKIIDLVQKRRRTDEDGEIQEVNSEVRNLEGGWVFCRNNVNLPENVKIMAIKAVAKLGLDFSALDIVKSYNDKYYILESNTNCGKEGTTLERYKEVIIDLINEINEI